MIVFSYTTYYKNKTFYSVHKKHKDSLKVTDSLQNDIYKIMYDFISLYILEMKNWNA